MLARDRRQRFRDCAELAAHLGRLGAPAPNAKPADLSTHPRRALELDPVSAFVNTNLGWVLAMASRFDEAVRQLETTPELDPSYQAAATLLGGAHLARGEPEKAFAKLERSRAIRSYSIT
jgi:Flp pilus assembly protein TadD